MTWLVLAGAVLLVVLVAFGAWGYQTANRLNRLNVRYDLSWQSLDSALARRAVVARAVAIDDLEIGWQHSGSTKPQQSHQPSFPQSEGVANGVVVEAAGQQDAGFRVG